MSLDHPAGCGLAFKPLSCLGLRRPQQETQPGMLRALAKESLQALDYRNITCAVTRKEHDTNFNLVRCRWTP